MRLFLDSNVWVSAFATKGLCRELVELALGLHSRENIVLIAGRHVAEEVARILHEKFKLSGEPISAALEVLALCESTPDEADWHPQGDFPDAGDIAIIAAALAVKADLFVTGDKALVALGAVENLPILDPRTAYLRLRGLG